MESVGTMGMVIAGPLHWGEGPVLQQQLLPSHLLGFYGARQGHRDGISSAGGRLEKGESRGLEV